MKSIVLSLLVLLPLGAFAQNRTAPPRPAQYVQRAAAGTTRSARVTSATAARVPGLALNVTLTLKGSLQGLFPVDLEFTGCGPTFSSDAPLPAVAKVDTPAPILKVEFHVMESRNAYRIEYSVGARVAQPVKQQRDPARPLKTIEYHDLALRGSAIIKIGEAVTLSSIAGKSLTLSMTEAKKAE